MDTPKSGAGKLLTRGLFYETALSKDTVRYTLKNQDHMGFPSLRRLYLETDDPSEYDFATTHLDGLDHWDQLCQCRWFEPFLKAWRRELDLRQKARALLRIKEEAQSGSKNSFAANKYLLERGWEGDEPKRRGRPTKAEVRAAATEEAQATRRLDDDLQRISNPALQ